MKLKFKPQKDLNTHQAPSKQDSNSMGKIMLALTFVAFLGMMTVFFQGQIDNQINPNRKIIAEQNTHGQTMIKLKRNRAGHYVSSGYINQKSVTFLLDTGATYVAIPAQFADHLGLKRGRKIQLNTANGRTFGYQTSINELTIGDIHLYNISAVLSPNLDDILLGMSALKQIEFSQRGNVLTLKQ